MKKYAILLLLIALYSCPAMEQSPTPITEDILKDCMTLSEHCFKEFFSPFENDDPMSYLVLVFCISSTKKCYHTIEELRANKTPLDIINKRYNQLIIQESENIRKKLRWHHD